MSPNVLAGICAWRERVAGFPPGFPAAQARQNDADAPAAGPQVNRAHYAQERVATCVPDVARIYPFSTEGTVRSRYGNQTAFSDGDSGMICGNFKAEESFFVYRSSSYLTRFFQDCDTEYVHDRSTRNYWVANTLQQILAEPHPNAQTPPATFSRVIQALMDPADALNEESDRQGALALLNSAMAREGLEAFYAEDRQCYLRHIATKTIVSMATDPHRPFSASELRRRERLLAYLDTASEDKLIEEVLLPLFRQLGFHRITATGHKDKALEYGKDVWMRFTIPTQHVLYFGIQAKNGKIDSSGITKEGNANVAVIHNQVMMMLGHEIFDPEIGKRVLVDHAIIVAGWGDHQSRPELAWQQARFFKTQSAPLHGQGRYS